MRRVGTPRSVRAGRLSIAGIALAALLGVLLGASGFTFTEAHGLSYLSNDPKTCVNCHIMRGAFDSWQKSSHHATAVCNDCHVPHDLVGKYWTKAEHGLRHSWGFTFQNFHEPIQIKASSLAAVQGNCLRCHEALVSEISHFARRGPEPDASDCVRCHRSVGHGANG